MNGLLHLYPVNLEKHLEEEPLIESLLLHLSYRLVIGSGVENNLGVFCRIDDMKVDIKRHPEDMLEAPLVKEGVRMWG